MNRIRHQLEFLVAHFKAIRQAGHTVAMLRGFDPQVAEQFVGGPLDDRHTTVVFYNRDSAKAVGVADKHVATLESLDRLRGREGPVLFDNGAIFQLLEQALLRIDELETNANRCQNLLDRIHGMTHY